MAKSPILPPSVRTAITSSLNVMLAAANIPQNRIDGALTALFAELDGMGTRSLTNNEPLDRALSRKQAADLLGCSSVSISRMVKNGRLRAVYGGADGKRLTGISEQSVRDLLAGKEAA